MDYLSDEDFARMMSQPLTDDHDILTRLAADEFTPEQLRTLTMAALTNRWGDGSVIYSDIFYPIVIITHPTLPNDVVETIIESSQNWASTWVFSRPTMTPEQIQKGLNHRNRRVRFKAYNHECCTEEQKVKYHLMNGKI